MEGKVLDIQIIIESAKGLERNVVEEVVCKYKWIDEMNEEFETQVITSKSTSPIFNYDKTHKLRVSTYVISHIWDGALIFEVYGKGSKESFAPRQQLNNVSSQKQPVAKQNNNEINSKTEPKPDRKSVV